MAEQVDKREAGEFFLNDPKKLDDPFPDMKYFRENRPIFYYEPFNEWFVFGHDDVARLFSDPRLSSSRMKGFVDVVPEEVRDDVRRVVPYLNEFLLFKDEPDHGRIRKFLHLAFNADVVRGLRGRIRQVADELLDRVQDKGRMDASGDFGFLLPVYVLSDFLGFPEEDREKVIEWSVAFIDFFILIPITVETTQKMVSSLTEMVGYIRGLLAERRREPRDDFLSILAGAEKEGMTEDEIVANAVLLLIAGHVAPRNLIGNVIYLLLTHRDQWSMLQANPELLHNTIEETLRYEPPVILIPRVAAEDFELHGNTIREGQIVQLNMASANRDEAYFPDPDRFDITKKPARHLSFGHGPHGCIGALLAREEARIALETLFRRMPGIELDETREIEWYRNAGNRGPITLPLVF